MTLIGILHVQNPQADWFVAVGKSEEFPSQWKKGKKDPFFNLTLVGLENSPGNTFNGRGSEKPCWIYFWKRLFSVLPSKFFEENIQVFFKQAEVKVKFLSITGR